MDRDVTALMVLMGEVGRAVRRGDHDEALSLLTRYCGGDHELALASLAQVIETEPPPVPR